MDDSERSYGYSRDIYHGRHDSGGAIDRTSGGIGRSPFFPDEGRFERSYEYGRDEAMGDDTQGPDFSPEEAAVRIRGRNELGVGPDGNRRGKGRYDFGTAGPYVEVDSFTWDIPGPFRGRGPRGYRRADERIHEDVCDRLAAHGYLDAGDIEVEVAVGEVTLSGAVPDRRSKRLAEAIAERVRGVVDVHNRLQIEGAPPRREPARQSESARQLKPPPRTRRKPAPAATVATSEPAGTASKRVRRKRPRQP
jgi:hypothetical protein